MAQEQCERRGREGLVVPLDGRIGSALTARLCQMAMEENAVAVLAADGPLSAAAHDAQDRRRTYGCDCRLPLELACNRLTAALGGTMAGSGVPPVTADREWTRSAGLRQRVQMHGPSTSSPIR